MEKLDLCGPVTVKRQNCNICTGEKFSLPKQMKWKLSKALLCSQSLVFQIKMPTTLNISLVFEAWTLKIEPWRLNPEPWTLNQLEYQSCVWRLSLRWCLSPPWHCVIQVINGSHLWRNQQQWNKLILLHNTKHWKKHTSGLIFVVVESESKSQLVALGGKIKGKQKQVVLRNDGMSRGRWGHYWKCAHKKGPLTSYGRLRFFPAYRIIYYQNLT